jgi:hypothetical protein
MSQLCLLEPRARRFGMTRSRDVIDVRLPCALRVGFLKLSEGNGIQAVSAFGIGYGECLVGGSSLLRDPLTDSGCWREIERRVQRLWLAPAQTPGYRGEDGYATVRGFAQR